MLILVGDNPESALTKLCGVCPIPASSGKTNRMRLNRGGNRQANAALHIIAIIRMRDHSVPETLYRPRNLSRTLCAFPPETYGLANIGAS